MKGTRFRAALSALSDFTARRPRWVVMGVVVLAVLVWVACLYSIASQIGGPFSGFFYTGSRVVSGFTPKDFTGWQAGLRPQDRLVEVNGQPWREIQRLVREAGIGGNLVYTVERGDQRLEFAVPTMEFTPDILLRFIPGYLFSSILFLAVGIFVYARNPRGRLNRYLLVYLWIWAANQGMMWELYLSQYKWTTFLIYPLSIAAPVAGWVFFWSFPADRARKEFLARWPLIQAFIILATVSTINVEVFLYLVIRFDYPVLVRLFLWSASWGYYVIFALGSMVIKLFPLLQIAQRKGTPRPIRQQAIVLLLGIGLGLTGYHLFLWTPASIHVPPVGNTQWGGVIIALYPLSLGYAILRYQLFDIRVVIRKGLVYSLLTAALTAVFLLFSFLIGNLFQGLTGQQSLLATLLPALLIAFLFQPVRNRIQTFVDRAFFRREVEVRRTLTAFGQGLSTLRERDEVMRLVLDTVTETLGAGGACLWFPDDGHYCPSEAGRAGPLPAEGSLVTWLVRERRPLLQIPGERSPHMEDLRRAEATLAVPLLVGGRLVGILTLREKRSGDLYTEEDLDLLVTLAHSTALALENARLHQERMAILRQQLAQVTTAQEEERRRIARELHDGVGPALASLNIRLRTVRKHLERDHHPLVEEIEELAEQTRTNIQDVRRLIYDLRPAVLDELGLIPALRQYVARYHKEQGIEVTVALPEGEERLPAPLETALFRIAQEGLANVAKHAQAGRVEIALERGLQGIILRIVDDGQGFDPSAPRPGTHLGLWGMRERVEQLGGRFRIESIPGAGTTLTVSVSLGQQGADDTLALA